MESRLEKIFDTRLKRRLFREFIFFEIVILSILKSHDLNKGLWSILAVVINIIYSSLCAYILIKDIDLRYDKSEKWEKYRTNLKILAAVGAVAVILAAYYFLK